MPNLWRTTVRPFLNPAWSSTSGSSCEAEGGGHAEPLAGAAAATGRNPAAGATGRGSGAGGELIMNEVLREALRMSMFLLIGPAPPPPPALWQATQEVSLNA